MKAVRFASIVLLTMLALSGPPPAAQTPAMEQFEVVSVKSNRSGDPGRRIQIQPGGRRVRATNVSFLDLLNLAYQVQSFQVADAPDWIALERFDVDATSAVDIPPPPGVPGPSPGLLQRMLQSMLTDRFRLASHVESREMPVYNLVRSAPRVGEALRPSVLNAAACAALLGAPLRMNASGAPACATRSGAGVLSGYGTTMGTLADQVARIVQRSVVDKTDLPGYYDFDLRFTPEDVGLTPADASLPSVFTALHEQLGLKLESGRERVSVYVLDRVERPAPD